MQVKKGLKNKQVTYLATLRKKKEDAIRESMLKEIKGVLKDFNNMMPLKLPRNSH